MEVFPLVLLALVAGGEEVAPPPNHMLVWENVAGMDTLGLVRRVRDDGKLVVVAGDEREAAIKKGQQLARSLELRATSLSPHRRLFALMFQQLCAFGL